MYSKLYKQLKFLCSGVLKTDSKMSFFYGFPSKILVSWIHFSSGQRKQTIGSSNSLDNHIIWNAQHPTEDYAGDINYIGFKVISGSFFFIID